MKASGVQSAVIEEGVLLSWLLISHHDIESG